MRVVSANFEFLAAYDEQLVRYGALAEQYFADDPNTSLLKLRQFAELAAFTIAAKTARYDDPAKSFVDVLSRLSVDRVIPREVADLFHTVRKAGNAAAHDGEGDHREALAILKVSRQIAIWFHRTFGNEPDFKPGPFVPPPDPAKANAALHEELEALRTKLAEQQSAAERANLATREEALRRETAEEKAQRVIEEKAAWEELATEVENMRLETEQRLKELQTEAETKPSSEFLNFMEKGAHAAQDIDLDETDTRLIIDQQLREQGWEADTQEIRYSKGSRPAKGQAIAIAEWPTASGPADYALFVGTTCVGVVEAKRKRKNVSAAIDQSERYAKGIKLEEANLPETSPWDSFHVPFVFATNGRPYLKQFETGSGIWFRDIRKATNHRRALNGWPTPEGLKERQDLDKDKAHEALKDQPISFAFPLRPYQKKAIQAVEKALESDQRELLLAMATGTGKTKLSIAMLYRLLEAKRFRHVCFVVDRNTLGQQASGEFATTKVVSGKAFAEIFGLKSLDEVEPEGETRVHICTIQGLVKRLLYQEDPSEIPSIDQYDLILVDECHRGYLLDRELSDRELSFRDETDYISKYRRVLEHFDAVKVGLTATPALHTVEIFGEPVFKYSYREAVVDGYLIDHEPPIRIITQRAQDGITFAAGEQVHLVDTKSGNVDLAHTPDEISFEVENFNRKVITPEFNRVVAEALAQYIDPSLGGKTLIFAVNDTHADLVVEKLKTAFANAYGEIEDSAVRKITGSVDKVQDLILSFRNDTFPKVAVTVDLLTTGIDVPRLTNLVFLRRVNSRILYEQMLGRATRLCPELGKETFRIFDAVDLYSNLQGLTDMRPVVINPSTSLAQLFDEMAKATEAEHKEAIRDEIIVKMARSIKKMPDEALAAYEAEADETPADSLKQLRSYSIEEAIEWIKSKPKLGSIMDWRTGEKEPTYIPISHHPDNLVEVTRGYGEGQKPEDFLDGFTAFVQDNMNKITALRVVVQRPRELTREQLRELRLELDHQGFNEASLRKAWQDAKNEDIAASIVGFIRQAALGDPLVPYSRRVQMAMDRILRSRQWTEPQRQWLRRIGDQIELEVVVDRDALNQEPFINDGGFKRLNRLFDGQLESILSDINEELWRKTG